MKTPIFTFLLFFLFLPLKAQNLPQWNPATNDKPFHGDWLIDPTNVKAAIYVSESGKDIILFNGLVKRTFRLSPDVACIDYKNMANGRQLLRAVQPEAIVNINGTNYNVGGLYGQREKAYLLPEWVDNFSPDEKGFRFQSYKVGNIEPRLEWETPFWHTNSKQPTGKHIIFTYKSSQPELEKVEIKVNYEIYDALPLISKWVEIDNNGEAEIVVNRVVNEVLAMVEEESAVEGPTGDMQKPSGIYFETNYAYNNAMQYRLSDQTTHWLPDTTYTSQVNYNLKTPCLLQIYPEKVSNINVTQEESFHSVITFELLQDSYDRERRGLAVRKMYRTIAPWITANPIFMHLVSSTDKQVYEAIDQCAATGYEALILSFGSHINLELNTEENHKKWKKIADYAHSKGIKIGGYTLFSSRKISPETDVIDPKTGKPGGAFFLNAPCFCSQWGIDYAHAILSFYINTGFDILEMDGPYPGDVCASTSHPGHKGLEDSQWRQMQVQKNIFRFLNQSGVYINAPDWYFLDGTHKIALGYREVNFALSREQQKILNRQNIFDGTWEKTPSMGWGFVPLTAYHGGGSDAVLEPLNEHLQDYKDLMIQYYGAGIQACYRGPRLYDTEKTKQTVIKVINWYKQYRDILNADIIHLRRADGRDWDGILHVDPALPEKGLAMLYNPTKERITRTIQLPVYYTGLSDKVIVAEKGKNPQSYGINRNYAVELTFTIEPESYTWFVLKQN